MINWVDSSKKMEESKGSSFFTIHENSRLYADLRRDVSVELYLTWMECLWLAILRFCR